VHDIAKNVTMLRKFATTLGRKGYGQCGFGLAARKAGGHVATVLCARRIADV
jgi:hypothetical protein